MLKFFLFFETIEASLNFKRYTFLLTYYYQKVSWRNKNFLITTVFHIRNRQLNKAWHTFKTPWFSIDNLWLRTYCRNLFYATFISKFFPSEHQIHTFNRKFCSGVNRSISLRDKHNHNRAKKLWSHNLFDQEPSLFWKFMTFQIKP